MGMGQGGKVVSRRQYSWNDRASQCSSILICIHYIENIKCFTR